MNKKYRIVCESINKKEFNLQIFTEQHLKKFGKQFESYCPVDGMKDSMGNRLSSRILLTEDENDWIGYISYNPGIKEIYSIEINPHYQRLGYGSFLLNKVFPDAEQVYTHETNSNAIKFFKKNGWVLSEHITYGNPFTLNQRKRLALLFFNPKKIKQELYVKKTSNGNGLFSGISLISDDQSTNIIGPVSVESGNTGIKTIEFEKLFSGNIVNDSDEPNIEIVVCGKNYYLYTIKFIEKGNELLINHKKRPQWSE